MTAEQWLTVNEIAERLKVTDQTVRRWLRSGDLIGRNFGGKAGYRVREADLQEFLNRAPR
jgi:excisionase family DNA binding protein